MNLLAETLGLLGGVIGLSISVPQILKVRRLGTQGVSATTWAIMYSSCCSWLGYGIRTDSPAQVLTNSVAMGLVGFLLISMAQRRPGRRARAATWAFLPGMLIAGVYGIGHVSEQTMRVILLSFEVTFLPQLARSFIAWRRKTPIPAVSNLTWSLSALSSLLWLSYAVVGGRTLVIVTALIALGAATLIVVFTTLANAYVGQEKTRRKDPADQTDDTSAGEANR